MGKERNEERGKKLMNKWERDEKKKEKMKQAKTNTV